MNNNLKNEIASFFSSDITGSHGKYEYGCRRGARQNNLKQPFGDNDREMFARPPRIHYPETWFHFIGGNVSLEGITADLEAISEAGISGVQLFHGQFGDKWPATGEPIACLSERWEEAVSHVANECKRLGLRFTMQNCPGWAMAGGPG